MPSHWALSTVIRQKSAPECVSVDRERAVIDVSALWCGFSGIQGLNFIAGLLLLTTEDEEATFWLLRVLVKHLLPDYYTRDMIGLLTDIEVLSELVRQVLLCLPARLSLIVPNGEKGEEHLFGCMDARCRKANLLARILIPLCVGFI